MDSINIYIDKQLNKWIDEQIIIYKQTNKQMDKYIDNYQIDRYIES